MSLRFTTLFLAVLLCLSPVAGPPARAVTFEAVHLPPPAAAPPFADPGFGELPLYFVPNNGQTDAQVSFYLLGGVTQIWFARDGVTFATPQPAPAAESGRDPFLDRSAEAPSEPAQQARWVVKLDFVGANPAAQPVGEDQQAAVISYFKGSPDEWHAGLPTYARIVYRDLWPGIDLAYSGQAGQLKYDFLVHPGADPAQIQLRYRGAERVALNAAGQMTVGTPFGGFTDDAPVSWQAAGGRRAPVETAYALDRATSASGDTSAVFGFEVGDYDRSRPLVIDPTVLVYCGYIGGTSDDEGFAIAVDGAGAAYVTGRTRSAEASFPVRGGPDLTYDGGNYDAFVAKVAPSGAELVYAGYIGGAGD